MAKHPVLMSCVVGFGCLVIGYSMATIDAVAGPGTSTGLLGQSTGAASNAVGEVAQVPGKIATAAAPGIQSLSNAAGQLLPKNAVTPTTAANGPPKAAGEGSATPGSSGAKT